MSIRDDFQTILKYSHMWNWAPDWGVVQDVYAAFPESYSVLTPFAFTYLEELIRSRTSEYKMHIIDKDGHEHTHKAGQKLLKLARQENQDDQEFLILLDEVAVYYGSGYADLGANNRNNVMHGSLHPRYWTKGQFEKLISDIAKLSPHAGF